MGQRECTMASGGHISDNQYHLRLFTVDAFTNVPFSGNPAAVCLDIPFPGFRDEVLQNIATEMNLSETAFVTTLQETDKLETAHRFNLRWFTPTIEWILCGHATLATAHVLFHCLNNPSKQITFDTLSGDLVVRRDGDFLAMDFPTGVTQEQTISDHENLLKRLFGGLGDVENVELCTSLGYLVIHIRDGWTREQFENWQPTVDGLPSYDKTGAVHLAIVTMKGRPEAGFTNNDGQPYDFASRVFAPWSGVPEDPVTVISRRGNMAPPRQVEFLLPL